jgi:hypothetical protein
MLALRRFAECESSSFFFFWLLLLAGPTDTLFNTPEARAKKEATRRAREQIAQSEAEAAAKQPKST